MPSITTYHNKFGDLSEEQLLQLGYETGRDLVELNRLHARLDCDKRKKIHRILQLLKIPYDTLSDAQKCYLLYRRYKEYLQTKNKDESSL